MNYFEKIFLGTTTFVGIVLFFLMGLYFDLGDMFSESMKSGGFVTRGATIDRLVDKMDKVRRVRKTAMVGDGGFGHISRVMPSIPRSRAGISARFRRFYKSHIKSGKERVEQYRAHLLKQGFQNKEYIQMKALAQDKTVLTRAIPVAIKLSAAGDIEEAITVLEDALTELPEGDYEQRIKLVEKLIELSLRAGLIDKAHSFAKMQLKLDSQILSLESESKLMEKKVFAGRVNAAIKSLEDKRNNMDKIFSSFRKRQRETGKYNGVLPEEKIQFKAEIMGMKAKGEISSEVYSEMLDSL